MIYLRNALYSVRFWAFGLGFFFLPLFAYAGSVSPSGASTYTFAQVFTETLGGGEMWMVYDRTGAYINLSGSSGLTFCFGSSVTDCPSASFGFSQSVNGQYDVVFATNNGTNITNCSINESSCTGKTGTVHLPISAVSPAPPENPFYINCATSTSSTCMYVVDNPNQDYFQGVLLLFIGIFFPIWLFKKRP